MKGSKYAALIATVGGVGYFPKLPGTVGSAVAYAFCSVFPVPLWGILGIAALGVWAADAYARDIGEKDPGEVVIDEVVGMGIACYGMPLGFLLPAFVLFRILDILKPVPISTAERLPGGWGIMADDVVGGVVANIILRGIRLFGGGMF